LLVSLFLSHTHLLVSLFLTTVLLGILFYPILLFLVPFIPQHIICCSSFTTHSIL
jgi:hypothetical protein